MPPTPTIAELTAYFGGTSSSASCPVAVGTPVGAPGEVMVGEMGVCKLTDQGSIPSKADAGPIVTGNPSILIHELDVAHEGSAVSGLKGNHASVEVAATNPTVLLGTPSSDSGAVVPASSPDWLDPICAAMEKVPGIGPAAKVGCGVIDATDVISQPNSAAAAKELGKSVAQSAGASAAVAGTLPACLELGVATGIVATPVVGGCVGVACVAVSAAGGSIVAGEAYELPFKLSELQQQQAAQMANKGFGACVPNPMGGGSLCAGGSPMGGGFANFTW